MICARLLRIELFVKCARDGVDNWAWYGESYEEVIRDFYPYSDPDDLDISGVADAYMKHRYHEMPVIIFPPETDFRNN